MFQVKEQDKNPQKQLNEEEIGNLCEKDFRVIILRMIYDLRKGMEVQIEKLKKKFNKEIEGLKYKNEQYN